MDHHDNDHIDAEGPAAAPDVVPDAAPVAKRPRTKFTEEQQQTSKRRSNLIARELERRSRPGQPPPPHIQQERRIDRGVAVYNNGSNVIGWRVWAHNVVADAAYEGTIVSVHMRSFGQGSFIIAIVEHDDTPLLDRAYEISCLERITN